MAFRTILPVALEATMNARHRSHLATIGVVILLVLALGLLVSTPALAAPPANDDFDTATSITSLPYSVSTNTLGATAAPDDPACFGGAATVWFAFTAPETMLIDADTNYSGYDTTLGVYTGARGNLSEVACNDDYFNVFSFVHFEATAGETYYFMIGALGGGYGGPLHFSVRTVPYPPANDTIDGATPISIPFDDWIDTAGATASPDEPVCYDYGGTVWYSFVPAESGYLNAWLDNYMGPAALSVYEGYPNASTSLGCVNAYYGEMLHFAASAGQTYYVMVTNIWGFSGGSMKLNLEAPPPPPPNDEAAGAIEITALPFSDSLDTTNATRAEGDASCADANATVWYRFTAPADMVLDASVSSDYYPSAIAVYTGEPGSLTQIACLDPYWGNMLRFDAAAGMTYYVMTGSAWGYPGYLLTFNLQAGPERPGNDDFDNATVISDLPFGETLDANLATRAEDDPGSSCGWWDRTLWYAFTPAETMWMQADPYPGSYDSVIAVYTGARGALTEVACRSDWYMGEPLRFLAQGGTTYYFMLSPTWYDTWVTLNLSQAPPPPQGDDFDDPIVITELPFGGSADMTGMTRADDDPGCGDWYPTIWYAYTPPADAYLEVDTAGDWYTAISIYTGTRGTLNQIACLTDWGMGETFSFAATGGETYYFMLNENYWPDSYITFALREGVPPPPPPPNDDFDNATIIEALPFSETVDVNLATWSGDDPYPSCGASPFTIWYAFTPPETMWLETDWYDGSSSAIAVFTGQRGSLTEVACRSDWYYGESLRFAAQGGVTYYFMVSSPSGGSVTLNVRYGASPPPNDDFDSATVITALPFSESVDMRYATNAWDDPFCATQYGPSIWYQFTAASSARLELTMNSYGTIGLYSGSRGALDELACANYWDGPLFFEAEAGRTYYISISASPYESALAVTLQEALAVSVTIDPTGTFDMKAGTAAVSGTVTCSRPVTMHLQIQMTQPVGRVSTIIAGTILWEFSCDGTTPWSVTLTPQSGKFAGGPATVTVSAEPYPYPSVEATASITLSRAPK
jgi:hypothetical protein